MRLDQSTDPARRVALLVLRAVGERDAYANLVLPASITSNGLSSRDAAFATALTYGTLRRQGTYDAIIAECVNRPLAKVDLGVVDVLRLGAHQLFQMEVPTHAAVSTSVELARGMLGSRPSGFVNAVMRTMSSQAWSGWLDALTAGLTDELAVLAVRQSHPRWIVELFNQSLGDLVETRRALAADNESASVTLAVRPERGRVEELLEMGATRTPWSPWGAHLTAGDPSKLPAVREGRAGVQDEGSQLVATAVAQARLSGPDSRWLDLCAGPGGKTALLGGLARLRGARLTAVELRDHRANLVRKVVGDNVEVVTSDATHERWGTGDYDRVLVDVPCSGLGALRRRPEARWRRNESTIQSLRPIQEALLRSALRAIRPGGVVGYVTCSPALVETTDVLNSVVAEDPDVTQIDARPLFGGMPELGPGPSVQLWPHRHGTDAMFLALVTRC